MKLFDASGNIVLNKIILDDLDNSTFSFKEFIPECHNPNELQTLTRDSNGNIYWSPENEFNLKNEKNDLLTSNIYYKNSRLGIGRPPLYNYVLDIAVPKNNLMTALHIGDGSFGFSFGNGTSNGFIPEIIGISPNKDDAGLYLIGITGDKNSSNIPLIIIDGRNIYGEKLINRPIFGITSADYNNYLITVDQEGVVKIKENVEVKDVIIDGKSLIKKIEDLQKQINDLKSSRIT